MVLLSLSLAMLESRTLLSWHSFGTGVKSKSPLSHRLNGIQRLPSGEGRFEATSCMSVLRENIRGLRPRIDAIRQSLDTLLLEDNDYR
jgi:hypothetical protein